MHGDKECPFRGVTKSGRVWRKVPESDDRSVHSHMSTHAPIFYFMIIILYTFQFQRSYFLNLFYYLNLKCKSHAFKQDKVILAVKQSCIMIF